jgi:hypothetical protein
MFDLLRDGWTSAPMRQLRNKLGRELGEEVEEAASD